MDVLRGYFSSFIMKVRDVVEDISQRVREFVIEEEDSESAGSMKDDYLDNKVKIKSEKIDKKERIRMKEDMDSGFLSYQQSLNDSTLTMEDLNKLTEPLSEEGLRIQEQVLEACERYKLDGGTITCRLEKPYKKRVVVNIGGEVLYISEDGIYSAFDTPYYIKGTMSKSWGLTRIVNVLGEKSIKLFIDLITIYEVSVYKELTYKDKEMVV